MSEKNHPPEVVPPPFLVEDPAVVDESAKMRSISRRSFVWAGVAVLAACEGLRRLILVKDVDGANGVFRKGFRLNEKVWSRLYSNQRLAPTYTAAEVTPERENGDEGLSDDFDPEQWFLTVEGVHGLKEAAQIELAEIKAMPSTTMTTELCCIEGWSIVQTWKGVLMREFIKKYPPKTHSGVAPDIDKNPDDVVSYVGIETPDGGYYVGLDMPSALHPQTMLCYEMNGKPLALEHGAPLRLVIPVKYGIKNLKRIGTIRFTDKRPADYWAEQGYDWYAGL